MNFFKRLLPPENKIFYDCFEDSSRNCKEIAILYNLVLAQGINEDSVARARSLKHKGSNLERETIHRLNSTFITPIDREDIQLIAAMLNSITKKIAKAIMNLNVYRVEVYTAEMHQQSKIILNATDELIRSVSLLKTISKTKEITASHDAMKEIEVSGDEILYHAMDKLFSGEFRAIEVIKLRDIYKDLESALNKCFSVSDAILNVALKNS